jgi:hypothetical protein
VILETTKYQLQRSESEKLIILHLENKLPTFYANRNFVALFTPAATELWPERAEFILTLYRVIQYNFFYNFKHHFARIWRVVIK